MKKISIDIIKKLKLSYRSICFLINLLENRKISNRSYLDGIKEVLKISEEELIELADIFQNNKK